MSSSMCSISHKIKWQFQALSTSRQGWQQMSYCEAKELQVLSLFVWIKWVLIQKKKEGGTGLWWGQEVVNSLRDLEEEMGLLKKNAISGGWADIKYLEINGRLSCYLSEINFVHKHMFYIVQFFHKEGTSAERCVRCITRGWERRGADSGWRLAGDSTSVWLSTLARLRHEQSVLTVCPQAAHPDVAVVTC